MDLYKIFQVFMHFEIGLLTILNPIAAAVIMLGLVNQPVTKKEIIRISKKTSLTVLIASLSIVFLGDILLKFFSINIQSIKVIGGIVLLFMSLNMIRGQFIETTRHSKEERQEAIEKEDISVVPLAIPILVGPGTTATLLIFRVKAHTLFEFFALIFSVVVASIVVYFVLRNSSFLIKYLSITGIKITTRIMGLIVGAISAQFIISGVKALWNMY